MNNYQYDSIVNGNPDEQPNFDTDVSVTGAIPDLGNVIKYALKIDFEQFQNNPTQFLEQLANVHVNKWKECGAYDDAEGTQVVNALKEIGTKIHQTSPNAPKLVAVKPGQLMHDVARYKDTALDIIVNELQSLNNIPCYDQNDVDGIRVSLDHELKQDQESHDLILYTVMSGIPFTASPSRDIDEYQNTFKQVTQREFTTDFLKPLYLNIGRAGGAIETLWEYLAWTDGVESHPEDDVNRFKGRDYVYNGRAFDSHIQSALERVYLRQILGLNTPIDASDNKADIAYKAQLVSIDAADDIHQTYMELLADNIDLRDCNGVNIPTPARVLLRDSNEYKAFFEKHCQEGISPRGARQRLKTSFHTILDDAAVMQVVPYLLNRQEYDNLHDAANQHLLNDMTTSIANAPTSPNARLAWDFRGRDIEAVEKLFASRENYKQAYEKVVRALNGRRI